MLPKGLLQLFIYLFFFRAELEEREKGREEQIAKILEEKGEFYSLVLVNINNKLALQNGLWAQLKHSSSNK